MADRSTGVGERLRPRRGQVWLLDLGVPLGSEQGLRRPGLVVSDDRLQIGGVVVVAPLMTTHWSSPVRVEVEPDGGNGLRDVSWVQTDHVRSVSTSRLVGLVGRLDEVDVLRVDQALARVLRLR